MIYFSLSLLLPALYITFISFRWLYRHESNKKNRIHFTKKTVWLILVSWLAVYFLHRILFGILNSDKRESFWLYFLIYTLGIAVISSYLYLSIKLTKSRKNLTKLLVIMTCLALYLPLSWWAYQVFSVGVYDGSFGINKKIAIKYTDEFIGPKINHTFNKAEKKEGYWLVTENLKTYDSKSNIDVNYKVDIRSGEVVFEHSEMLVPVRVTRANGNGESLEMMFFVDNSSDPQKPDLKKLQYSNTDGNGNTSISMKPGTDLRYYLQVRDCSFSCTSTVFKLKSPIKDKYDIVINPYQPLTEI